MSGLSLEPGAIARRAGSDFEYDYVELVKQRPDAVEGYIETTRRLFAKEAKTFDAERNTEWFVRSYLALKFVLAATLKANSGRFAAARNLQVVQPYLAYYTMLSCCRAFIFTLPCMPWRGAASVGAHHEEIVNVASDKLKRLHAAEAVRVGRILQTAREQRNIISYRFPATGLGLFGGDLVGMDAAIAVARLFAELAQLNLACLEGAVRKQGKGPFELLDNDELWRTMTYDTKEERLIDDDDWMRAGYFLRRHRRPVALVALANKGLVEDFFGAWHSEGEDVFDPDDDYTILFDLQ